MSSAATHCVLRQVWPLWPVLLGGWRAWEAVPGLLSVACFLFLLSLPLSPARHLATPVACVAGDGHLQAIPSWQLASLLWVRLLGRWVLKSAFVGRVLLPAWAVLASKPPCQAPHLWVPPQPSP